MSGQGLPPGEGRRARAIQPLRLLPVFLDVADRPVFLSGRSHAAVWKAELLLAAGARLHLQAEGALSAWHDTHRDAARLRRVDSGVPDPDCVCWVAEADDAAHADALKRTAAALRIPINVIDRPDSSSFQFGSIVNRSPVVVAISTGGAVPALGQALRSRIETLLPPALGSWAAAAARLRPQLSRRFADFVARRDFWRRVAELALLRGDSGEALEVSLAAPLESGPSGRVTLVGAGPGDPGLLTLNAVRALQSADVVLFDDLVSDEVLELSRREAQRMLVGKRSGQPSCRQEEIVALMLRFARAGKHVVRLKGGDPGIFGRAGEELDALRAAEIPYHVVPGITAALAMAAAFGVSLTHRDHAQCLQLVTGHARTGSLPADLDWAALARARTTTLYYMAARTIADIVAALLAHGLDPATPAAWVADLSRAGERRWLGRLDHLPRSITAREFAAPLLVATGAVFGKAAMGGAVPELTLSGTDSLAIAGSATAKGGGVATVRSNHASQR